MALVLLYNIRLKQNFSIERFQSYTASKIGKFQYNRVVFSTSSLGFVECLIIYPVNAKKGSALQVSRDQTSSFKWLGLVSFSIQTSKKESGWYSLACVRLASNPGSIGIQG